MPELSVPTSALRKRSRTLRIVRLAERQGGVVSWAQLRAHGYGEATISRSLAAGALYRVHPQVYAVGRPGLEIRGRLNAALLYGGPAAAISHQSAGWWWELLDAEPETIHVSAPGDRRSLARVRIHHPRDLYSLRHRGLPVTSVERTLRDMAAMLPFDEIRMALAQADFRGRLNERALRRALGRGRPGAAGLRAALDAHLPALAATNGFLEQRFLLLVEGAGLPLPEVNVWVGSMKVDALWRPHRLVVELDGQQAHGRAAAVAVDRRRELALRSAGIEVRRYSYDLVIHRPRDVIADLRTILDPEASALPSGVRK